MECTRKPARSPGALRPAAAAAADCTIARARHAPGGSCWGCVETDPLVCCGLFCVMMVRSPTAGSVTVPPVLGPSTTGRRVPARDSLEAYLASHTPYVRLLTSATMVMVVMVVFDGSSDRVCMRVSGSVPGLRLRCFRKSPHGPCWVSLPRWPNGTDACTYTSSTPSWWLRWRDFVSPLPPLTR